MNRIFLTLLLVISALVSMPAQDKLTAAQVVEKSSKIVTESKGLIVDFAFSNNGNSGKGVLKASGNKFNVKLPGAEIWYNGKHMYTYNDRTKETTVITPTPQELAESNPLIYVKNQRENYEAKFSSVKKAGKYIVELTPKKKEEIQKLILTMKASDYSPEKIIVQLNSGQAVDFNVTEIKRVKSLPDNDFEYPKSKYSGVELIDLR